jgi:hypothetical protein
MHRSLPIRTSRPTRSCCMPILVSRRYRQRKTRRPSGTRRLQTRSRLGFRRSAVRGRSRQSPIRSKIGNRGIPLSLVGKVGMAGHVMTYELMWGVQDARLDIRNITLTASSSKLLRVDGAQRFFEALCCR